MGFLPVLKNCSKDPLWRDVSLTPSPRDLLRRVLDTFSSKPPPDLLHHDPSSQNPLPWDPFPETSSPESSFTRPPPAPLRPGLPLQASPRGAHPLWSELFCGALRFGFPLRFGALFGKSTILAAEKFRYPWKSSSRCGFAVFDSKNHYFNRLVWPSFHLVFPRLPKYLVLQYFSRAFVENDLNYRLKLNILRPKAFFSHSRCGFVMVLKNIVNTE